MLIFVKGSWCNRKTRNWKAFIQISMIVNLKSLKPGTGIDIKVVSFTKITMLKQFYIIIADKLSVGIHPSREFFLTGNGIDLTKNLDP